jgi:putative hydrolase of the HAD superfamily
MTIASPDFRHVDTWLFDLDNTLYRADSNLFSQIDSRMTMFISEHLDMPMERALQLQHTYYRECGTTLGGLMTFHAIDPEIFLAYVHDIDLSALKPNEALKVALARLPGRRLLFTNGCRYHAKRVLDQIGLSDLIDDIWDIRALAFTAKPNAVAYKRLVAKAGIAPEGTAMFEDMARNLVAAHALGMTTVWLNNGSHWSQQGPQFPMVASSHIHHETDDLADFLHAIRI